jgi:AcrR family transcriptional regulator
MAKPSTARKKAATPRPYESPLRQARAALTRARILAAGSALAHEARAWDWRDLTVRAIAERAGISERTVYRHFPGERQLHEALMRRLEQEAGVSYDGIALGDVAAITARVFAVLPRFAVPPSVIRDETFAAIDERRQEALLKALGAAAAGWTEAERRMAAGMLDVLWSPTSYERLVAGWGFASADATRAVTWALDVLAQAVREGRRPMGGRAASDNVCGDDPAGPAR